MTTSAIKWMRVSRSPRKVFRRLQDLHLRLLFPLHILQGVIQQLPVSAFGVANHHQHRTVPDSGLLDAIPVQWFSPSVCTPFLHRSFWSVLFWGLGYIGLGWVGLGGGGGHYTQHLDPRPHTTTTLTTQPSPTSLSATRPPPQALALPHTSSSPGLKIPMDLLPRLIS